MASIGDLFFSLRGDDKQLLVDVAKSGDKAGTSFGSRMSASLKKSWSGGEIGKGLVQGLGLAGGLGAAALFTTAISKVGDVLMDATQAALAEEVSIQKLGTALKANIPAWNGNTAAIEDTLKARMKLGFSDDEQRESLALLVVATKDVNKALEVQRTAMDLSRLKGISLKEASEALIKVEAGQFRALKALGIQLPKNATAQEALTAVQKVATGQAEDYADTNAGKLLVSQVKIGEAMEKIGAVTMPIFVEGMVQGADAVVGLVDALGTVDEALEPLGGLGGLLEALPFVNVGARANRMANDMKKAAKDTAEAGEATKDTSIAFRAAEKNIGNSGSGIESSFGGIITKSKTMAQTILNGVNNIKTWVAGLRSTLVSEAALMIDGYYDPIIAQQELLVAKDEAATAQREMLATKAGTAERRQADLTLANSRKNLEQTRVNLLAAGTLSKKEQAAWLTELQAKYKTATGDARLKIGALIAKIKELQRTESPGITVKVAVQATDLGSNRRGYGFATGGSPPVGVASWVGERGRELIVPRVPSVVIPHGASEAMAASGGLGGTIIYQLTTNGLPLREPTPAAVLAELRRATRIGAVKPPRHPPTWDAA